VLRYVWRGYDAPLSSGQRSRIDRVVVKEVNWLGDLVMSLPALRLVRSAYAAASLSVLVREELSGFFDGMDWVDEVIPYSVRGGTRGWGDQSRLIAALQARRFDLAILFPNSFRSALWAALARIPRRAGYAADGRRFLLTDCVVPNASAKHAHQRFYWIGMVSDSLGISSESVELGCYRLEVSHSCAAQMREWLTSSRRNRDAPIIAISPSTAYGPAKEWPASYYAELIDLLDQTAGAECVLIGTQSEHANCQRIASMSRKGAIIAAGNTSVAELKALLSLCDGFAGNDSGAMHLAAALAIPTVGIFGSTNPVRTGPIGSKAKVVYHPLDCSPCLQRTCRFGHYQCMRGIAPSEIVAALLQLGAFTNTR
jgi:heptosyltransferase II